mmetsp:Transcript_30360/g.71614  ORF Transcript_30360/g.71614 Transcript_30360/m.71614 type:complete len:80 (+) Transcript_30360:1727-1966(+)
MWSYFSNKFHDTIYTLSPNGSSKQVKCFMTSELVSKSTMRETVSRSFTIHMGVMDGPSVSFDYIVYALSLSLSTKQLDS